MESNDSSSVSNQASDPSKGKVVKLPTGMLDPTPSDSVQNIVDRNKLESPLLKLPAEIRNIIFALALGGRHIVVSPKKLKKDGSPRGPCAKMCDLGQKMEDGLRFTYFEPHFLGLLSVCRQIYAEAALIPFSVNHFWIKAEEALVDWKCYDHVSMAQIQAIEICQFWVYMGSSIKALSAIPAVKKVYIMSWSGMEFISNEWMQVVPREVPKTGGISKGEHVFKSWDGEQWHTEETFSDQDLIEDENSSYMVERRIREVVGQGAEIVFIYGEYPQPKTRPLPWFNFF